MARIDAPHRPGFFSRFSRTFAHAAGHPYAFWFAAAIIVAWGVLGPVFGFSDTWQLVVNTATTIVTFLMVFLIQNTQNRDTEAIQLKLDELIKSTKAHNTLLDIEELDQAELDRLRQSYLRLAQEAREHAAAGEAAAMIGATAAEVAAREAKEAEAQAEQARRTSRGKRRRAA